jgi:hypothetical protein
MQEDERIPCSRRTMNDQRFISTLNTVWHQHGLRMPVLREDESPSSEFLAEWAAFLEDCVKKGIGLSDSRWQRVTIATDSPGGEFTLLASAEAQPDADFRVGLQLLMGLLGSDEPDQA